MREDLLGYLLGALEPSEQRLVETRLLECAQLRHELELLRNSLAPLEADAEQFTPPAGLVARTCRLVSLRSYRESPNDEAARPLGGTPTRWRVVDMLVAAGIVIAASMLFFPAVAHSRFQAKVDACQNNLRVVGQALLRYSQFHDGYFPVVPVSGNLSMAGVYAPTLLDHGFLDGAQWVCCPGDLSVRDPLLKVPTLAQLEAAGPRMLIQLRRTSGGSYGYLLGYVENGRYYPHRNLHRANFAILADAPDPRRQGSSAHHDFEGQNMLFEDGHVDFRCLCDCGCDDNIYMNVLGVVGAGIGRNDCVLGRSDAPPVLIRSLESRPRLRK